VAAHAEGVLPLRQPSVELGDGGRVAQVEVGVRVA
jgi:hypothetical protein